MKGLEIVKIESATARTPARYRVILNGWEIGLLEKYRNTRTDTHPWKALGRVEEDCGVRVRPLVHVSYNGRDGAVNALIENHKNELNNAILDTVDSEWANW